MDIGKDLEKAYNDGYEQGRLDAVKHGKWEKEDTMSRARKCSECKGWYTKFSILNPDYDYCPNCGARMDK